MIDETKARTALLTAFFFFIVTAGVIDNINSINLDTTDMYVAQNRYNMVHSRLL